MKPPKSKTTENMKVQPHSSNVTVRCDGLRDAHLAPTPLRDKFKKILQERDSHTTRAKRASETLSSADLILQAKIEEVKNSTKFLIETERKNLKVSEEKLKELDPQVELFFNSFNLEEARENLETQIENFKKCKLLSNVNFEMNPSTLETRVYIDTEPILTDRFVSFRDNNGQFTRLKVPQIILPKLRISMGRGYVELANPGLGMKDFPFTIDETLGALYKTMCLGTAVGGYLSEFDKGNYFLAFMQVLAVIRSVMNGESGYHRTHLFLMKNPQLLTTNITEDKVNSLNAFTINAPRVFFGLACDNGNVFNNTDEVSDLFYLVERPRRSSDGALHLRFCNADGDRTWSAAYNEEFFNIVPYTPTDSSPTHYLRSIAEKNRNSNLSKLTEKAHLNPNKKVRKVTPRKRRASVSSGQRTVRRAIDNMLDEIGTGAREDEWLARYGGFNNGTRPQQTINEDQVPF